MPPTDHEFENKQRRSDRSISKLALNPFSNILTCHFAFDAAKKSKTAQIKKLMLWPVNGAARFSHQIIEIDNTAKTDVMACQCISPNFTDN